MQPQQQYSNEVKAYLLSDRQWKRRQRISHAFAEYHKANRPYPQSVLKRMRAPTVESLLAKQIAAKAFWLEILHANGVEFNG